VYRRRDPARTFMTAAAALVITVAILAAVIACTDLYARST
jgi:hypothetical protein